MSPHAYNRRRYSPEPLCSSLIVLFAQPFVLVLFAERRTYPGQIWAMKNPSEVVASK